MMTADERLPYARAIRHSLRWGPVLGPLSSIEAAERILADLGGYDPYRIPRVHQGNVELLAGALLAGYRAGAAMIDRQHGRIVFHCDMCSELDTEEVEFQEAVAVMTGAGWAADRAGGAGDWVHHCPYCYRAVMTGTPVEIEPR